MPWKRPSSLPLGQVWSRFEGRSRDGKPAQKFQIRDLDPQYIDQCLDLMTETFLRDEPLCKALGVPNDPISIATTRSDWRAFIDQGISLACFTEVDGQPQQLVGFNILVVRYRGEEEMYQTDGEPWLKLLKVLDTAESLVNVFDHYGVDQYLSSSGLTVLKEFRGQNIGGRIFDARKPLCKALGITVSATVFTAITSQVLAAKCGYELLATLNYADMIQHGIDLKDCESQTAELRAIKYTFD